jgi:hypothetical protein
VENNIQMDFKYIEWDGVEWVYLTRDRMYWQAVVNTVMKLCVP